MKTLLFYNIDALKTKRIDITYRKLFKVQQFWNYHIYIYLFLFVEILCLTITIKVCSTRNVNDRKSVYCNTFLTNNQLLEKFLFWTIKPRSLLLNLLPTFQPQLWRPHSGKVFVQVFCHSLTTILLNCTVYKTDYFK